ncbi:MAG: hypothetical protein CBE08_006170 [Euryarchaeota archaeon TMED248]|nr:MAG: hypothetical protein CBE08_006170 [Euryarchaeota archaeon TMED248]|tara:strand:- start:4422 stop:5561 length:1140 start_codon:yes stop_codon:yes gene_type:complete
MIYKNVGYSDITIMSDFLNMKYLHFEDSEEMAWGSVVSWLSRLRLLEGVPFPYIVPSEGMLPNDSIRFFHVDRNWLDALVDGALSVGIIDSRGALAATEVEKREELYQKLMSQLNEREITANPYRRSIAAYSKVKGVDFEQTRGSKMADKFTVMGQIFSGIKYEMGGSVTGFLLRSSIVRDYPGIEITAYHAPQFVNNEDHKGYDDEYLLDTLRQVRLSESIMLCLFNGIPSHLRIKEPSEGIRLGVDNSPGKEIDSEGIWKFEADFKDINGIQDQNKTIPVSIRSGTNDTSVLKISDLLEVDGWTGGLSKGGLVATQLMQFPYQQDFQYDSVTQFVRTDSDSDAKRPSRVNTNSITIDESFVEHIGNKVERKNSGGGQ